MFLGHFLEECSRLNWHVSSDEISMGLSGSASDQSNKDARNCPVQITGPAGAIEQAKEKIREWLKK